MFVFLYLIGPGCLSYLIRTKVIGETRIRPLNVIAEIMMYSAINTAIVLTVLKPFHRANLIWLEDEIPFIQYGAIAIILSMIIAIALVLFEKLVRDILSGRIKLKYSAKNVSSNGGGNCHTNYKDKMPRSRYFVNPDCGCGL